VPRILLLPPWLVDRHLQALAGYPARVAAFTEAPGELINLTIAKRRKMIPGLRLEWRHEVSLLEQQIGGIVQRLPQPRVLCQRNEREIDDKRGERIKPAAPGGGSVMLRVLIVAMARFGGCWLASKRRDPYSVEIDEPQLPFLVDKDITMLQVTVGELSLLENGD
jgi:hypothetical protein